MTSPERPDPPRDHGPRLSDEEYERRIVELHRGRPPMPDADEDRRLRRQELELAIDHRLGANFPPDRREALWAVRERVERQRLRLGVAHLARRLLPRWLAGRAQGLAGAMVQEYATVLNPHELRSFFSLAEGEAPALPIDLAQVRRK